MQSRPNLRALRFRPMRKRTKQPGALAGDAAIVAALRAGDEQAVAEDVVQEAWLGVLKGLDRFEERSSLKTWIFRIVSNVAKTRGEREGRSVPFSSLAGEGQDEQAVDPDRFFPPGRASAGAWAAPPHPWEDVPEDRLLSRETEEAVAAAIETLPDSQRTVITLRDVDGWSSDEVCNVLGITETNQRVLLHRARSKVRTALERYLDEG